MRRRLPLCLLLAAFAEGCSLLYPFELPAGDAGDVRDGEGGADADADVPDAETTPVCGDSVVESPEECEGTVASDPCRTSCGSQGTQKCVACVLECQLPFENCNGADDDCDGETDEGYPCAASALVACTAPCGRTGEGRCTVACELPAAAACTSTEVCNGCDDNRDGTTDEGCRCATGWAVEHPLAPGPASLRCISIARDGTGFAVGGGSAILRYDGSHWWAVSSTISYALEWVHAVSATFAVAVGGAGGVLWWNGTAWRFDSTTGITEHLWGAFAFGPDDVWAVGANGIAIHWDGSLWTTVPTPVTTHLWEVWGYAPDDVYATGRSSVVLHWDGTAWTRISPSWGLLDADGLWGPGAPVIYVGVTDGTVKRWDGAAWTSATVSTTEGIDGLWGTGPDDIWAVGGWAGGVVAHWDGTAWTDDLTVPGIDRRGQLGVSGNAADNVFIVSRDGGILHYDGTSWLPMEGAVTASLRSVWGASPQDVFALGSAASRDGSVNSVLLRYDGTRWLFDTATDWIPAADGQGIWAAAPTDVFVVAADELVRRFHGATWTTSPTLGADVALYGVWAMAADQVVVVGGQDFAGGFPRAMHGSPGDWTPLLTPELADVDLLAVSGTTVDDAMAVGTGGAIFRRRTGEDVMEPLASGTTETLRGVWVASATEAFAVGDNGTILHWDGTSWTLMTAPTDPWVGFRLYGVWGSSPTNVFAVGESSMLLRYGGSAWTQMPVDVLADLTDVWGSAANNVFVVADDRSGIILHRCGSGW